MPAHLRREGQQGARIPAHLRRQGVKTHATCLRTCADPVPVDNEMRLRSDGVGARHETTEPELLRRGVRRRGADRPPVRLRSRHGAGVAAEGGLSASTVRYYYRNQSHLLACAFAAVDDHFSHELGRHPFAPGRLGRGTSPESRTPSTSWRSTCRPMAPGSSGSACCTPTRRGGGTTGTWRSRSGASTDDCSTCATGCLRAWACRPRRRSARRRILRAVVTGLAEEVVTLAEPPEGELGHAAARPVHRPRGARRVDPAPPRGPTEPRSCQPADPSRRSTSRPAGRQGRLTIANLTS